MRHRKKTQRLGRDSAHRKALLAGLVCNLIEARRIRTTLPKARAARGLAERMVTLGKKAMEDESRALALRRLAIARIGRKDRVATLFSEIAPAFTDRTGGYTRITKLGRRPSDSSEMAFLEWVNYTPRAPGKPRKKAEENKSANEKKAPPEKKPAKEKAPDQTKAEGKSSPRKKAADKKAAGAE